MHFQFEQTIPLPRDTVCAFHTNPAHLAVLHRNWPTFRLIHHNGTLEKGNRIWFEINVARILPIAFGFESTEYMPPARFSERLIHGPFATFDHTHTFDEVDGGTVVRDILEVVLPLHYGGELATRLLVAPALRRAFALRNEALQTLAESGALENTVRQ